MKPISLVLAIAVAGLLPGAVALTDHLGEPPEPARPDRRPDPRTHRERPIQLELQTMTEGNGLTAPTGARSLPVIPTAFSWWTRTARCGRSTSDRQQADVLNTAGLLVPLILDADERGFLGAAFHPTSRRTGGCTR